VEFYYRRVTQKSNVIIKNLMFFILTSTHYKILTMYSSTKNDDKKSNGTCESLIGLILWGVVLGNTSSEVYDLLDKQWYYKLAINNTVGFGIIFAAAMLTMCSVAGECDVISKCLGGITVLGGVGLVIANMVYIGLIMDADIDHTFIGYKDFWSDGAMNFTRLSDPNVIMPTPHPIINATSITTYADTPHWPYVLSDVLVRICTGSLMVVLFVGAFFGVVMGGGFLCSKCKT
jgi:hypothetical protein